MEKAFKLFIGLVVVISFLFFSPLASHAASKSVPILMYHYIRDYNNPKDKDGMTLSVSPVHFDEQMGYLSSHGYTPITLDTLAAIYTDHAPSPSKPVVITFDDGYSDFHLNAYSILKKYNFHAVSFIPTGLMNGGQFMTWDQIKEIQKSGLVTFEAHSVHHVDLTKLNKEKLLDELKQGKSKLEEMTGYPVNFIAYPAGRTNGIVQRYVTQTGYIGGIGTWFGKANGITLNMPRIRVNGGFSLSLFASRL